MAGRRTDTELLWAPMGSSSSTGRLTPGADFLPQQNQSHAGRGSKHVAKFQTFGCDGYTMVLAGPQSQQLTAHGDPSKFPVPPAMK